MKLLGLDTSGKTAAAAIYDSDEKIFLAHTSLCAKRQQSQIYMPLLARMLDDLDLSISDLDGLAVCKGPGSYTGLRIGVAGIQAMAFAGKKPCVGISTLEAIAYTYTSKSCDTVLVKIPARQSFSYVGIYRRDAEIWKVLLPDQLMDDETLSRTIADFSPEKIDTIDHAGSGCAMGVCLAAEHAVWQPPEQLRPAYLQKVQAEKDWEIAQRK